MRIRFAGMALSVALLAAAASGCAAARPTASQSPEPPKPALTLIVEPQAGYQPIYDFISGARVSLDMTMYQLGDTKAQDALKAAAKRGVKVRVLLDSDTQGGGNSTMNQAAYSDLTTSGVEVKWAWSGTLWHQKSISRDGASALVMTCNLYAPYYAVVRDFAVMTHNRATVAGMEATFDKDWQAPSGPPTPRLGASRFGLGLVTRRAVAARRPYQLRAPRDDDLGRGRAARQPANTASVGLGGRTRRDGELPHDVRV